MTVSLTPSYFAGIGCRKGAGADEIVALVQSVLDEAGLSLSDLGGIGTLDRKAAEPGLQETARRLGLPLRMLSAEELDGILPPKQGPVSDHTGLPGIAEAIARRMGTVIVPKRKSANATCALGFYNPSAATASSSVATSVAGP